LPETLAEFHEFDGFAGLSRAVASAESLEGLDPWVARHLDRLAALEAGWARATEGDTLLHVDLRADNMLITADGRVVVVDWPHAAIGAAWVDLPRRADPDAVTATLCALAGFFLSHGRRPDPPGLPTLRRFQLAQAAVAIRWLRRRTGWR